MFTGRMKKLTGPNPEESIPFLSSPTQNLISKSLFFFWSLCPKIVNCNQDHINLSHVDAQLWFIQTATLDSRQDAGMSAINSPSQITSENKQAKLIYKYIIFC